MRNSGFLMWLLVCLIGLAVLPDARAGDGRGELAPLLVLRTAKPMERALSDLKEAIGNNNYVFIRQQNIDSRLTTTANENSRVVFVYFCNFGMLDQALKVDSRVGVFLPCMVMLIQRPEGVELVAVNPKLISSRLNDNRLNGICDQLTEDYRKILEEASL
jgi:cytochrome c oxidase cbb3-type subunit 3